ncbi:hypothetical protein R1sor_013908 [Riccia sorocarpa]|uniref:Uncharacterized protein n=1 Tax=Riccia sorocarpa TaxID=122646 RepID=A0ABD3HAS1_9MARC
MVYCNDKRMQAKLPQAFMAYFPEDAAGGKIPAHNDKLLFSNCFILLLYAHAIMRMKVNFDPNVATSSKTSLRKAAKMKAEEVGGAATGVKIDARRKLKLLCKVVEPQVHEEEAKAEKIDARRKPKLLCKVVEPQVHEEPKTPNKKDKFFLVLSDSDDVGKKWKGTGSTKPTTMIMRTMLLHVMQMIYQCQSLKGEGLRLQASLEVLALHGRLRSQD